MNLTLEELHGRVLDLDSHERVPLPQWGDVWGDRGQRFADFFGPRENKNRGQGRDAEHDPVPDKPGMYLGFNSTDTLEISRDTVFASKGTVAPSAIDLNRRPAVLDMMGVQRALLFPGMALIAWSEGIGGSGLAPTTPESRKLAWDAVAAHNEWAGELTTKYSDRMRVVGILADGNPEPTVRTLIEGAERLLSMGVRAVLIPVNVPLAGVSPADPSLDPFYSLMAEANVPLITHPPAGLHYSPNWQSLGPIAAGGAATSQLGSENFIRIATLGGVFERHPTLQFGAIEQGSWWLGAMVEFMDFVVEGDCPESFEALSTPNLSMRPSEYVNRNVRVTPWNFEQVDVWFERYPQIQNAYCFSTDYPHVEGREWALPKMYDRLASLGDDALVEKFFCTNGELILP